MVTNKRISLASAAAVVGSAWMAAPAFGQYGLNFLWNRAADFTPRSSADANTSNGNPDGDSTGRPCWSFEVTSSAGGYGGLASATPWYTAPTSLLVWDDNWNGFGTGLWARGNEVAPPISGTYLQHRFGLGVGGIEALGPFVPVVRWSYPGTAGGCPIEVRISGNVVLEWSGNNLAANTGSIDLAIVIRRADGAFEPLLTGTHARPATGVTKSVPVNVYARGVSPGDAVLVTHRSTAWNGQNWNYLYDNQLNFRVTAVPSLVRTPPVAEQSCTGSSVSFSVTAASSGGPFAYQWRKGGVPVNAATNPSAATRTLTFASVLHTDSGYYDCLVTSACGSSASANARLIVDPADVGTFGGFPGHDGMHDNNDFIAFINYFFELDLTADLGRAGGELGGDGLFDNNDFVAFIELFFSGC